MKQFICHLMFFSLAIPVAVCAVLYAQQRTEDLASKLGYPKFMINLRNRAGSFLTNETVRMNLDVEDLRNRNQEFRAHNLQVQNKEKYELLENRIDQAFEELNLSFIKGAVELDDRDASDKERTAFINRMKDIAQKKIDELVK